MFSLSMYPLNFSDDALMPYMSADTIKFHFGKHFNAYINNLNNLIAGTEFENMNLNDIIAKTYNKPEYQKIFNNAGQVFNHNFFFAGLAKDSDKTAPAEIVESFGSLENFFAEFKSVALAVFGSGWVWLVRDEDSKLKITYTANANTPIATNQKPVLALDVWEHAYYLDYQNDRGSFIDNFLSHLINWEFVGNNLK